MKTYHNLIELHTVQGRNSFHDLREDLEKSVEESQIKDGILVVSSAHTTCSLYFDETMHDVNFYGDEFLQVDINEVMEKIAPKMTCENQYHSPGPKHVEFGLHVKDSNYPSEKWVMLNTDAHLKASLYGSNSMTLIIKEGKVQFGTMGRVYFVDWDTLRERDRKVNLFAMGV